MKMNMCCLVDLTTAMISILLSLVLSSTLHCAHAMPEQEIPPLPPSADVEDESCVPFLPPFQDSPGPDALPSNTQVIFPSLEIKCNGVVLQWSAIVQEPGPSTIHFQVWRRTNNNSSIYSLVGSNDAIDVPEVGKRVTLDVDSGDRIQVYAGDIIGLYVGEKVKSIPKPGNTALYYTSEVPTTDSIDTASTDLKTTDKLPLLSLDIELNEVGPTPHEETTDLEGTLPSSLPTLQTSNSLSASSILPEATSNFPLVTPKFPPKEGNGQLTVEGSQPESECQDNSMLLLLLVGMVVVLLLVILILGSALALAIARLRNTALENSNKTTTTINKKAIDDDDESIDNPSYSRPAPAVFSSLEEDLEQVEEPALGGQDESVQFHVSEYENPSASPEATPATVTGIRKLIAVRDTSNFPPQATYTPTTHARLRAGISIQPNVSYTTTSPSHTQVAKKKQVNRNASTDSNQYYELIRTASTSNNYDHHTHCPANTGDYQSPPSHWCCAAPGQYMDMDEAEPGNSTQLQSTPPPPIPPRPINVTL